MNNIKTAYIIEIGEMVYEYGCIPWVNYYETRVYWDEGEFNKEKSELEEGHNIKCYSGTVQKTL